MFRRLTEVFDELCQSLLSRHTEPRTRCPVTQLSRRDTNPHQGLSQRCVCLLRMGVEAEHESFTAFFEAAGGDGPHSELARIRNPPDRHRLHCSLGPLHGQRKECGASTEFGRVGCLLRYASPRPRVRTARSTRQRPALSSPDPTTIEIRARSSEVTTCPGPASIPARSVTAGGIDSAEKKDSWLTE